ncbi:MAG: hypothetical protein ACO3FO_07035 [Candidatus Nanopelagicaceae bacterium]
MPKAFAVFFAKASNCLPSLFMSLLAAFEPLSEYWVRIRATTAPIAIVKLSLYLNFFVILLLLHLMLVLH